LDAAITRVDAELEARLAAEHEAIALLETIPGVARRTAEVLVAEIGTDLSRFPRPSTWPPGRACAQATPRAAAATSVAAPATATPGCGVPWLRSLMWRAG
jgi:transposase